MQNGITTPPRTPIANTTSATPPQPSQPSPAHSTPELHPSQAPLSPIPNIQLNPNISQTHFAPPASALNATLEVKKRFPAPPPYPSPVVPRKR